MKHAYLNIGPRKKLFAVALAAGLLFAPQAVPAMSSPQSAQQQDAVSGIVTDSQGEAIIGASVKVQGGNTGTVTDLDGRFSLSVSPGTTLEISYIGFKTLTVKATSAPMMLTMHPDDQTLNEVVVVGFGTQKKVNLTGAVSVVGSDEFEARPVTSAAQALQGAVPGLQISSSSGTLDSTPSINIRGTGTIGQGSSGDPLILIDGAEGDINTINPQDIESVSVLKDAAASSIYGSRAPFGVILITTKKGKKGKPQVNYNNSFRFGKLIRGKHMMNSVDFASWMNDYTTNGGGSPQFDSDRMAAIEAYHNATPYGKGSRITSDGTILYAIDSSNGSTWNDGYGYGVDDVDWYDVVYKGSTFSQEHNASVSGASDVLNYYASFNYLDNNGFMKLNDETYNRYSANVKLGVQLASWLQMNVNTRFTRTDYRRPANLTSSLYSDMARQGWPTLPLYDRNGYYYSSPSPALGLAEGGKDTTQRDIINQQINFLLEPIKNWKTHIDFTYRVDDTGRHWDSQTLYNHDVNGDPVVYSSGSNVYEGTTKENYFNFQAYSEYSFTLNENHNFQVMGGFQAEQEKQKAYGVQRNGILDPSKSELDLTTGSSYYGEAITPDVSGARNQWQTAGFFGRINYNYAERYLFEANIRYDGTSRFRREDMWKAFPSASLGWNIAREKFFEPINDIVGTLKLRLSYGSLGNQNTDDWYPTYQTVSYTPYSSTWLVNGSQLSVLGTPSLVSSSLTWETVETYNIGLDWGLFNNRLTGSFDFYVRNTKDMVGNAPELPAILGTDVPVTNNTDLRTTGWELTLAWRDQLSNGLAYGVSFNLSDARTKITRYPNNPTNSIDTYIEGRYLNEIWGYETKGLARTDEEMEAHLANVDQSSLGSNWAAGDIMYEDLDGDGKISEGSRTLDDHGDLKVIGNSTPRFFFGLDLTASWKGFDFRAFFQGVMKRDYWAGSSWGGLEYLFGGTNSGVWWATGITAVQDYFRNEDSWSVQNGYRDVNLDAWLPRPVESSKNIQTQSRYLLNAAYMRLKNLQVGYTIPRSITNKWGISNLRVFFSAENLWTLTDMPEQFDPELIGTSASTNNGYPLSCTFSFGLNVSF